MPIKLQYASDLHLEFPVNKEFLKRHPLQPEGDILVLAGDIVPFSVLDKHRDFFTYVSDYFETTFWLPGNHEYYHFDITEKSGILHEKIRKNVFLVNNTSVIHGNTKLIFSTLWSKISQGNQWHIERNMNDFRMIKHNGFRFSSEIYNHLHAESLSFIQQELEMEAEKNVAVVTHHCPTFLNYPEKYKADVLNEAFAMELYYLIENSEIAFWIYGHHHSNIPEFSLGKTKMLTNQLGYVQQGEHGRFEPNKWIEI